MIQALSAPWYLCIVLSGQPVVLVENAPFITKEGCEISMRDKQNDPVRGTYGHWFCGRQFKT